MSDEAADKWPADNDGTIVDLRRRLREEVEERRKLTEILANQRGQAAIALTPEATIAGSPATDTPASRSQGDQVSFKDWLKAEIDKQEGWFLRMEIAPGLITPGWCDPKIEKLPHFGLPDDMTGMRVLDIGCAEGFFSFEAERRGAREVVAIDSFPTAIRRFDLCRAALNSRATGFLTSVYDLSIRAFGTFDLVMFFGVLYHLRNPILALEKIFSVCGGTLLLQSNSFEDPAVGEQAMAQFHPFGVRSGPPENPDWDPGTFWIPNSACIRDMLAHVGFQDIEWLSASAGQIFRAKAPQPFPATSPDYNKVPWS